MIRVNVAELYSKTPGGRYKNDGDFSGEDFRIKYLSPMYKEAAANGDKLEVNLDGGYGYGSSFLEESFGGLVRELGYIDPNSIIVISDEEPQLKLNVKKSFYRDFY